jgi:hypothetical protein
MSTSKSKERVISLTGSITAIIAIFTVQAKNIYLRVKILNTFLGDRKKFKVYEAQYRMYL